MTYPQLDAKNYQGTTVIMHTNRGDVTIKLFDDLTPKTVKNFVTHAKDGYYDGQIFHRVINEFMIQGGDPTGTGMGGTSIYGDKFEDEFVDELLNVKGALSMANAGPNTNGSQFFIVQASQVPAVVKSDLDRRQLPEEVQQFYLENGGTPWLDGKHTVFGQVIEGLDIVDDIAKSKVDMADKPLEDVILQTVEVIA